MAFNPVELIARKRDGKILTPAEIQALVDAYTHDELPDYQMSAFLMAAFINGLNQDETAALTRSMLYSGEVLDLSDLPGIKVDKHSTGGVGDKVSLLLAPIVAACGVPVPMISGRGLGHSGGTLDKLESIPGFRVDLDVATYRAQLEKIGVVMVGQTREIAPADRKMYALRDVTATVANISFIAPSIMSKKIASGIDALVLDVKCGQGAFMKSREQAKKLAEQLVLIGEEFGKPTVALMTAMDQPLGYAVGNWLEMEESIRCLRGEWVNDLMEVTLMLAGEMLVLGGVADSAKEGYQKAKNAVDQGHAFAKLMEMVAMQGGDVNVIKNPDQYPAAKTLLEVRAHESGYVQQLDALTIGRLSVELGAGRIKKEDDIDPQAGIILKKKIGDHVDAGDCLAEVHVNRPLESAMIEQRVLAAYSLAVNKPTQKPILMGRFTPAGWTNETN